MECIAVVRVCHTDIIGDRGSRVAYRLAERNVEVTADLDGIEALFFVPIGERADRAAVDRTAVDAAVAAGVKHTVYLRSSTPVRRRPSRWLATTTPPRSTFVPQAWGSPSCAPVLSTRSRTTSSAPTV